MKEFLEYDTYIFETDAFEKESIIKDEKGNEIGKAIGSRWDKEVELYDSQGSKWGTVKEIGGTIPRKWVYIDHNEIIIAKTKKKMVWNSNILGQRLGRQQDV